MTEFRCSVDRRNKTAVLERPKRFARIDHGPSS